MVERIFFFTQLMVDLVFLIAPQCTPLGWARPCNWNKKRGRNRATLHFSSFLFALDLHIYCRYDNRGSWSLVWVALCQCNRGRWPLSTNFCIRHFLLSSLSSKAILWALGFPSNTKILAWVSSDKNVDSSNFAEVKVLDLTKQTNDRNGQPYTKNWEWRSW